METGKAEVYRFEYDGKVFSDFHVDFPGGGAKGMHDTLR